MKYLPLITLILFIIGGGLLVTFGIYGLIFTTESTGLRIMIGCAFIGYGAYIIHESYDSYKRRRK